MDLEDRLFGVLMGTAVGDAVGLPAEGIGRARIARLFPPPWRHRFLPGGIGMISDDTEHTVLVAQAILAHAGDVAAFRRRLGWSLRAWFVCFPAGVGMATLRACARLWLGWSPVKSGVFSAGNGPAMRAGIIGAYFAENPALRDAYLEAATYITHTDPKALTGARAVALVSGWMLDQQPHQKPELSAFLGQLHEAGSDPTWQSLVAQIQTSAEANHSLAAFADCLELQKGVTGYIYHTVPVALYACWHHWGDFETCLSQVLALGGDTDTVGAITGAMAGALCGAKAIPKHWQTGLKDWPRGRSVLHRIATQLSIQRTGGSAKPVPYSLAGILPRNIFFFVVVLLHGFRRLLPPYAFSNVKRSEETNPHA